MGREYEPYPEYRASHIEWLRNVPASWPNARMDDIALTIKDQVSPEDIALIRVVHYSIPAIQLSGTGQEEDGSTIDSSKFQVEEGDVLFSKLNPRKQTIAIVCTHDQPSVASTEFIVLRLKSDDQRFLRYLLCSQEIKSFACSQVESATKSHQRINPSVVSKLKFALPSKNERDAIANFLDHETAKIDTLIEKQQQLIKLLKEKRQAVISHAVTKGLNPDVPMRDSGVEWLGEVPEGWGVSKFNYEIDFLEGPGILAYDFFDEGVPLLRIQNVKEEFVTDNFKNYLAPSKVQDKWNHFRVELGDLIISCSASTGLVSEVDKRCVGAIPYTGLIRLRPKSGRISKDFISFIVQSDLFFEQINVLQTGSTMQHFGPYHLQQMYITLPSLEEQVELACRIKQVISDIDILEDKANEAILLMQERRTALISAAVTGKIDVRNWIKGS